MFQMKLLVQMSTILYKYLHVTPQQESRQPYDQQV